MTRYYLMCMCVINIIKMCLCDTLRVNLHYLTCRISLFCGALCFSSGLLCFCFFDIYHLDFCWCICWFWFSHYSLYIAHFESCSLWVCVSQLTCLLGFLFNLVNYQVFGVLFGVYFPFLITVIMFSCFSFLSLFWLPQLAFKYKSFFLQVPFLLSWVHWLMDFRLFSFCFFLNKNYCLLFCLPPTSGICVQAIGKKKKMSAKVPVISAVLNKFTVSLINQS